MEFKIIGHACLEIRAASRRLVVDPWLAGPVYWGSWWHYPAPAVDESLFQADFIYLTHWHFDHFHAQTLARFKKDCRVFVPKFPVSALIEQVNQAGLNQVTEMTQARAYELAPGFEITSFQVQCQDDSVLVVRADDTVLIDLNDAKPMPSTWRSLKRRFPQVDFALRSHSSAWSFPTRFSFDRAEDALPVDRGTYLSSFRQAMAKLQPRYAIPFASGICHLHRETLSENPFLVSGDEMKAYMDARPLPGVETVVMPPGSIWRAGQGFALGSAVPAIPDFVTTEGVRRARELEELYRSDDQRALRFSDFCDFFGKFLRQIRLFRPFLRITWDFRFESVPREYWRVQVAPGRITQVPAGTPGATSTITVHPGVLADGMATTTFTNIDIAKRWRVAVHPGGLTKHLLMMTLVALYEAGYLDWKRVLRPRAVAGLFRRLPEAVDYFVLAFGLLTRGTQGAVKRELEE